MTTANNTASSLWIWKREICCSYSSDFSNVPGTDLALFQISIICIKYDFERKCIFSAEHDNVRYKLSCLHSVRFDTHQRLCLAMTSLTEFLIILFHAHGKLFKSYDLIRRFVTPLHHSLHNTKHFKYETSLFIPLTFQWNCLRKEIYCQRYWKHVLMPILLVLKKEGGSHNKYVGISKLPFSIATPI